MKIYVLRHGETNENVSGIMQGNMDTVLNQNGKQQTLNLRAKIENAHIDLVITSPKKRTKQTALLVAPNIPIIEDDRLLSRDHGEFEGTLRSEINWQEYWDIKLNKKYQKAESVGALFNRVSSLLDDISKKYQDKTILLVTHSGITRILYYYFNGFNENIDLTKYKSTNCSLEQYEL